jgi:hypothetical protein
MEQEIDQIVGYVIDAVRADSMVELDPLLVKDAVISDALESGTVILTEQVDRLLGEVDDEHEELASCFSNLDRVLRDAYE